jgi:hypothetical protein
MVGTNKGVGMKSLCKYYPKVVFHLLIFAAALSFGACKSAIDTQLSKYEFSQLVPPANFYPPGTILKVDNIDPFVVRRVCSQTASLGPDVLQHIERSDTATSSIAAAFTGDFELGAHYMDQLKNDSKFRYVRKVRADLSNVYLLDLPTSEIFRLIRHRDPECIAAVNYYIDHRDTVTLVYQALVADAEYSVEYDSSLHQDAKATLTQALAARLAGSIDSIGLESFMGKQLIWGVRDDQRLVRLSEPLKAGMSDRVLPVTQGIASNEFIDLQYRNKFLVVDSMDACLSRIPPNASTGARMLAENNCRRAEALRAGTVGINDRASAGAQDDTLEACMMRIPKEASAGQRMLAEESCKRDEAHRN